jgi:hypothetical protein
MKYAMEESYGTETPVWDVEKEMQVSGYKIGYYRKTSAKAVACNIIVLKPGVRKIAAIF